jgi:hypothetical protein
MIHSILPPTSTLSLVFSFKQGFSELVSFTITKFQLFSVLFLFSALTAHAALDVDPMNSLCEETAYSINSSVYVDRSIRDPKVLYRAVQNSSEDTVHIFTHGKPGSLLIDGVWLDAVGVQNWLQNNFEIENYTRLHIYGCNFAQSEKGKKAIAYLENELGLTVAASTDITGRDGDWHLEIGNVDLILDSYAFNLQCTGAPTEDCDNDGVTNENDIDDDNDGVLDVNELGPCSVSFNGDGSFESFNTAPLPNFMPRNDEPNGNITSDGSANPQFLIVNGSPDTWLCQSINTTFASNGFIRFNLNTPCSPSGGEVYAGAWKRGDSTDPVDNESFKTSVSLVAGEVYKISFYQSHAGIEVGNGAPSSTTPIGEQARWRVNLEGVDYFTQDMPFEGEGSQTWSLVTIMHTATSSGSFDLIFAADEGTDGGSNIQYVVLDGLSVQQDSCLALDSDGDGIANQLDLDSDNDGIPDNIEAQSTLGYEAPLGTDADGDGLDDRYDSTPNGNANGEGSIGIDPENTDGVDNEDYLDLDSDNDGVFDIDESGSGLIDTNNDGRTDGTVGVNGLDNVIDITDNFLDVNGRIDDPSRDLDDLDDDVGTGGDVDYRDQEVFFINMPTQIVLENLSFTSVIPTVVNVPFLTITYTLGGVDAGDFTIDSSTGVVSMLPRDFENPADLNTNNFYNVTIIATDANGAVSDDFTVIVNNECEIVETLQNTLRATDPVGDVVGDTGTLQVEVVDGTGTPRVGVSVTITKESGPGTIAAATGVTNASGIYTTTVSSTTAGIATYLARYAAGANPADTDVELGNPTSVRFVDDINNVAVTGEVGIATDTPDPSSALEIAGTDKGLLLPNVSLKSSSDTVTIPRPTVSLMVYNTNDTASLPAGFVFFNGSKWVSLCQEPVILRE